MLELFLVYIILSIFWGITFAEKQIPPNQTWAFIGLALCGPIWLPLVLEAKLIQFLLET